MFSFHRRFAALLTDVKRHSDPLDLLGGRTRLTGRFGGRTVTFFSQRSTEHHVGHLVVSMATDAPDQSIVRTGIESGTDRDLEWALFALEGRHGLRLEVKGGWLRAIARAQGFFFPGRFDAEKWTDVLENLRVAAHRLERRTESTAAADGPDPVARGAAPAETSKERAFTLDADLDDPRRLPGMFVWKAAAVLVMFVGLPTLLATTPLLLVSEEASSFGRAAAIFGGILLATGVTALGVLARPAGLLVNERGPGTGVARTPFGGWLWLLLGALVALPVYLVARVTPLVLLWVDMIRFLDDNQVWGMADRAQELSGIILVPVFVVLAVPALHLVVGGSVAAGALVLIGLLLVASPSFPRAFLVFVLLVSGLVIASHFATWTVIEAGLYFETFLEPGPERDVSHAAFVRYGEVLQDSAAVLTWTAAGLALWIPALFLSRRTQGTFLADGR